MTTLEAINLVGSTNAKECFGCAPGTLKVTGIDRVAVETIHVEYCKLRDLREPYELAVINDDGNAAAFFTLGQLQTRAMDFPSPSDSCHYSLRGAQ